MTALENGNLNNCSLVKTAKLFVENKKMTYFEVVGYFISELTAQILKEELPETEKYDKDDFEITTIYLIKSEGKYFSLEDGITEVELADKSV